jgi:hypothetical protein
VFFQFVVEVGVGESIVNAPPDYNSDQLIHLSRVFNMQSFLRQMVHQMFKSNLTFCVVCVFELQFEKSVFLRQVAHSQSALQRQLGRQILKNTFTY